jgi:hypothetical protein
MPYGVQQPQGGAVEAPGMMAYPQQQQMQMQHQQMTPQMMMQQQPMQQQQPPMGGAPPVELGSTYAIPTHNAQGAPMFETQ